MVDFIADVLRWLGLSPVAPGWNAEADDSPLADQETAGDAEAQLLPIMVPDG